MKMTGSLAEIESLLGAEAPYLLEHTCRTIPREMLYLPGADFVDRVWAQSDRSPRVLRSLASIFDHGRLGGTGYLSLLPVDHGITRGAGSAFAANPRYFDPEAVLELAIEGGCSALVTTRGVLGVVARQAHRIPFILKLDHDEILTHPRRNQNVDFADVTNAWDSGCVAVASTLYFGSPKERARIPHVADLFAHAHELGMATVLFCYLSNPAFQVNGTDHHFSADLTGQANHLGATLGADIIKQKLPASNGGFREVGFGDGAYGGMDDRIYTQLTSDHPIDLTRYQVANAYMGRCGLVNSGGEAGTANDLAAAVRAAVINKRAGGMGLIAGRKAFQRPLAEGVEILHAIQDVYRNEEITVA